MGRYRNPLVLFLTLLGSLEALAQAPQVAKVEPPNWWVGHSINPVRVMIRGAYLSGGRVDTLGQGTRIGLTRINAAGTYLFTDVWVGSAAEPGPQHLRISTAEGSVEAPFELLVPLSRTGRFQGFSPDDVIYLLMPDRFANGDPSNDEPQISKGLLNRRKARFYHGGDFQGIIDHLPYLKDLGVTAIWLNPFYDNANRLNERERYNNEAITDYHGYGATDFYGVEEHFGTLGKLQELVDTAHRFGLKIIQDQVANHTGPYSAWVQDPPTPTWFNGTEANHLANTWQVWTLMDPHATPRMRRATLDGWFIDILPDLNQDDEEVSRYLIQNALWWVGITGLDGIRQDTLPYVPRRFWHDWMAAIKREYPGVRVVGEVFDGDPALVSFFQGGKSRSDGIDTGIDTLFDFPLLYPLRRAFAEGRPLRDLAVMLGHDRLYVKPELLVTFLGLHDMTRFASEPDATPLGLRLADTFLLTTRGIPLIYYGDEIGMPGGNDPDNRRDFPGGWPADQRNAFAASGRTPEEQAIFEHVRRLAHLRAELAPLRRGKLMSLAASEQMYAYGRVTDAESVLVIFNNGTQEATLEVPIGQMSIPQGTKLRDRLDGASELKVQGGSISVTMPARSAAIYTR
jgi:neopullulanase